MFWKCGRKSRKSRGEKFVIFETELFVRDTIRINMAVQRLPYSLMTVK